MADRERIVIKETEFGVFHNRVVQYKSMSYEIVRVFDRAEWDVEVVLTPKFKPGYYRFIGETRPPTDVSTRGLVYYDTPPWSQSKQNKDPNNYKRYSLVEE